MVSGAKSMEREKRQTALHAAQLEKTEAYLASDWTRVWELTHQEIPRLEQELDATDLAAAATADNDGPLEFRQLSIELMEAPNSFVNIYFRRRPRTCKSQVKIRLDYSPEQRRIVDRYLLDHVIFYQSFDGKPVKASALIAGSWTSDPMPESHVETTAENAREGIGDLRLIIQERAARFRA